GHGYRRCRIVVGSLDFYPALACRPCHLVTPTVGNYLRIRIDSDWVQGANQCAKRKASLWRSVGGQADRDGCARSKLDASKQKRGERPLDECCRLLRPQH